MKKPIDRVEAWRVWMQAEADYARRDSQKFLDEEQARSFCEGITSGHFPWADSALNYLNRAVQRRSLIQHKQVRLRIIQEVGKAAYNHIALGATALWQWESSPTMSDAIMTVIHEQASGLVLEDDFSEYEQKIANLDASFLKEHYAGFEELQGLWKVNSREPFMRKLGDLAMPVQRVFIHQAENYGWPAPGLSSSDDVTEW